VLKVWLVKGSEGSCNLLQFFFLKSNQPMTNFKNMKTLLNFLKVKNTPCKHWSDFMNCKMAKTMHCIIIQSTKVVIQKAKYLVINCDEVTTIDNQC
jgi:hypothetical protein